MATRKQAAAPKPEGPWRLTVSRDEARKQLEARVSLAIDLLNRQIETPEQLEAAERDYHKWTEYNGALLERLFTDDRAKNEYSYWGAVAFYERTFPQKVKEYRGDIDTKVRRLESITERLELADEPVTSSQVHPAARKPGPVANSKVFIVHGRDNGLKEAVARFVEKLRLDAVILHEQANQGRTIIEKVEAYGGDVAFAIVLLSPDDIGSLASESEQKPRPRQNVVFELGYFFGLLGRSRVAAIVTGSVEKPTDTDGVVYIDGSTNSWRFELARELKAVGLPVDLNDAA